MKRSLASYVFAGFAATIVLPVAVSFLPGCAKQKVAVKENDNPLDADSKLFLAAIRGEIPKAAIVEAMDRRIKSLYEQELRNTKFTVGRRLLNGESLNALELQEAANSGDPYAQLTLGYAYLVGPTPTYASMAKESVSGIPLDKRQAYLWLTRAANQNMLRAQWSLSVAYETGDEELELDFGKALYWIRRLINQADSQTINAAFIEHQVGKEINNGIKNGDTSHILEGILKGRASMETLTSDEQIVYTAFQEIDYINNGKSTSNDRPLTPEELRIVSQ